MNAQATDEYERRVNNCSFDGFGLYMLMCLQMFRVRALSENFEHITQI